MSWVQRSLVKRQGAIAPSPGNSGSGNKSPGVSSNMLHSMASLTGSQLDSAIMEMLNIPNDGTQLQRMCQGQYQGHSKVKYNNQGHSF